MKGKKKSEKTRKIFGVGKVKMPLADIVFFSPETSKRVRKRKKHKKRERKKGNRTP